MQAAERHGTGVTAGSTPYAARGSLKDVASRGEMAGFALILALSLALLYAETLTGARVLSPADTLLTSASFRQADGSSLVDEPGNRLLVDAAIQFEPWLLMSRESVRDGRLPLWNDRAGCGAPLLANGQSAVFDPFHALAYWGPWPWSLAGMAVGRLWIAGIGMFLFTARLGLGPWGRWFSGLSYPFCGFLTVWLLFPVTNVAVWLPWLLWATDRLLKEMNAQAVARVALFVALALLSGHVQTAAEVLCLAGLFALARGNVRFILVWGVGAVLGVSAAAAAVLPLAVYLTRSPVWADRQREFPSPWILTKPRWIDPVCTMFPYALGSQRRGHPNLARAVGAHNLNESAGGFAGLACLSLAVPVALFRWRRDPRVRWLAGVVLFGGFAAFGFAPVANLLRAVPVLDVIDHRRMTLWVAFGLVVLGGIGLDSLAVMRRSSAAKFGVGLGLVCLLGLIAAAGSIRLAEPWLSEKAINHYRQKAGSFNLLDGESESPERRAVRQVRAAVEILPRYYLSSAVQVALLCGVVWSVRRGRISLSTARASVLFINLADLWGFGAGLNPAITPEQFAASSPVIARLRELLGEDGRAIGVGAELLPNTLMRFGLADARNYDSIELTRSLDWFEPLYDPDPRMRSSRREVTWEGVHRAWHRLIEAGVRVVVSANAPPENLFPGHRIEKIGSAWLLHVPGRPRIEAGAGVSIIRVREKSGRWEIDVVARNADVISIHDTHDPGWLAEIDGRPVSVVPESNSFFTIAVPRGAQSVVVSYDPVEVRVGTALSLGSGIVILLGLLRGRAKTSVKVLEAPKPSGYNQCRSRGRSDADGT